MKPDQAEVAASWRDALGQSHGRAGDGSRIVSLVPSITELVCDLGLAPSLVGRTGFCIHPREVLKPVAKVGGTKDVRIERVRALEPTHLIVNVDENTRETVDALSRFVPNVIVTHPCTPEDNVDLYRLLGGVFDRQHEAAVLEHELLEALGQARTVAESLPPEPVLYLIWRDPWMTVSRETYISAMLACVGWSTVPAEAAMRYPLVDLTGPFSPAPERVLLSSEPYRFRANHVAEVAAMVDAEVSLIDGEQVSWYGSRAIGGLRYLSELRARLARAASSASGV